MSELYSLIKKREYYAKRMHESQTPLLKSRYFKTIADIDKQIEQIKKDRGIEKE